MDKNSINNTVKPLFQVKGNKYIPKDIREKLKELGLRVYLSPNSLVIPDENE